MTVSLWEFESISRCHEKHVKHMLVAVDATRTHSVVAAGGTDCIRRRYVD